MKQVEPGLLKVMERSMDNIRRYHEKQRQNSWFDAQPDGTILGQKVTAWRVWECMCPAARRHILPPS